VLVGLDCLLLNFSLLTHRPKSSIAQISTYFFCPPPDQHTQSIVNDIISLTSVLCVFIYHELRYVTPSVTAEAILLAQNIL